LALIRAGLGNVLRPSGTGGNHRHDVNRLPEDATNAGQTIEEALRAARELLGMQIAWIAEFRDGKQVFRVLDGETASFGFSDGGEMPLNETYCHRLAQGSIPNAIPDTAAEPMVRDLEVTATAGLGSYVGVPIERDGTVYGTLCCASHRPNSGLTEQDVNFLHSLSRRVATQLEELGRD
jgi:GAF domain-containing protein